MSDGQFEDPLAQHTPADEVREARRSLFGKKYTPLVKGSEHLPQRGPVLVVATYLHSWDAMVMKSAIDRDCIVLGANRITQTLRKVTGRTDPIQQILLDAAEGFYDRKVVVVFPENLPSPDGALHRGNTLVSKVILENAVPVIPAVISTVTDMPQYYGRPLVEFGERIRMSRWHKFQGKGVIAERAIADLVMYTLMELSGRPYSDVDAAVTRMQQELSEKRAKRVALARTRSRVSDIFGSRPNDDDAAELIADGGDEGDGDLASNEMSEGR